MARPSSLNRTHFQARFSPLAEPSGKRKKKSNKQPIFVIQVNDVRRLEAMLEGEESRDCFRGRT